MSAVRKGYGSYIGMVLGAAGALLLQLPAKYHSTSANCTGGACRQQQDCHSERHGERLAGRISSGGRSQKTKMQITRPAGVTTLSFFVFGTLASGLAALMLLVPGSPLDVLWRLNPHAHAGFLKIGHLAASLMSAVCLACASAALGLWRVRRWGLWTAISILSINLLGDTLNAFLLRDWGTLIGLPIAG